MSERPDLRDRLGEALRRLEHGLLRPLWIELPEEHREDWRLMADFFLRILPSVGLSLTLESGEE